MKTILCFGDSNTYGLVAAGGNERYPRDVRWPRVMERALGGGEIEIIEEGLNGRTTVFEDPVFPERRGYSQLLPCVMSHEPLDLIVVALGTNDVKDCFGASPMELGAAMEQLLKKLLGYYQFAQNRPQVLVVGPPPLDEKPGGIPFSAAALQKSRLLAPLYKDIAARYGCCFFDAGTVVHTLSGDNIHFSGENHKALGEALAAEVRRILL